MRIRPSCIILTDGGLKYFSINDKGHVAVTPREGNASVDLKELMDELQVRDVTSPVLVRFPDILDNGSRKSQNVLSRLRRSMATRHRILSFIR